MLQFEDVIRELQFAPSLEVDRRELAVKQNNHRGDLKSSSSVKEAALTKRIAQLENRLMQLEQQRAELQEKVNGQSVSGEQQRVQKRKSLQFFD